MAPILVQTAETLLHAPPKHVFECGEAIASVSATDDGDGDDDDDDDESSNNDDLCHLSPIVFYCTWRRRRNHSGAPIRVECQCRDRSQNVLLDQETAINNNNIEHEIVDDDNSDNDSEEDGAWVDPNFFDAGYTLAGRTGFQVWAGTRLLLECLTVALPSTNNNNNNNKSDFLSQFRQQQEQQRDDKEFEAEGTKDDDNDTTLNVLELGSGVGVLGLSLAATGNHKTRVLLTDLPTLVQHSLVPNLQRNAATMGNDDDDDETCPEFLQNTTSPAARVVGVGSAASDASAPPLSERGGGWAGCTPLDWTVPVEQQLSQAQRESVDLILASDCVFLSSMLHALLNVVESLFASSPRATLLLSFQRRDPDSRTNTTTTTTTSHGTTTAGGDNENNDKDDDDAGEEGTTSNSSSMFATVPKVWNALHEKGWKVKCLAWRPVHLPTNGGDCNSSSSNESPPEVFVFEVKPFGSSSKRPAT